MVQTQARIEMIICKLLKKQNTNSRNVKVYRRDKFLGVVSNEEVVCNHEYNKGHYWEYYFNYNCCRKNIEKNDEGICKNSDDDKNVLNCAK
ncbi:hypothetical protein COBT_003686, partial [Conglomerata obtusa]